MLSGLGFIRLRLKGLGLRFNQKSGKPVCSLNYSKVMLATVLTPN